MALPKWFATWDKPHQPKGASSHGQSQATHEDHPITHTDQGDVDMLLPSELVPDELPVPADTYNDATSDEPLNGMTQFDPITRGHCHEKQ